MRKAWKATIKVFGTGFGVVTGIITLATFMLAYLSPTKSVVVHINRCGEAAVELPIIWSIITISIIAFAMLIKDSWFGGT